MIKPKSVDHYVAAAPAKWQPALEQVRALLRKTDLEEGIKWMFPCYFCGTKNVVGIGLTKDYLGIWFFQGALLSDPAGRLVNAQEGKTVAMRQLRFPDPESVDLDLIRAYVAKAIENQRAGIEIAPQPSSEADLPPRLESALDEDPALRQAYDNFAPYQQREFTEYITGAKREATKDRRLAKILPMIRAGVGLSDKYRK